MTEQNELDTLIAELRNDVSDALEILGVDEYPTDEEMQEMFVYFHGEEPKNV